VNKLAHRNCQLINKELNMMFLAVHHDFPESMIEFYFNNKLTPQQTLDNINSNAELENAAEARMS
jgi:hypothetical protein